MKNPQECSVLLNETITSPALLEVLAKAIGLKNQKKYREAIELLDGLKFQSASVFALLGYCHWETRFFGAAIEAFEKAVELAPKSSLVSMALNVILTEVGLKKEAEEERRRFVKEMFK